ncbi:MAG: hypothetical protein P8Y35_00550 [Sulfurovaceae bacterium]
MLVLLTIVLTFSTFIAQGRLDLQLPQNLRVCQKQQISP